MSRQKEYDFSTTTKLEIEQVEKYLKARRYTPETIRHYSNYIGLYIEWLADEILEAELVNYEQIKTFIFQLKKERSIKYINRVLIAMNHYYEFLGGMHNPVKGLRIRGERRNLQHYFIEYEELEQLYQVYDGKDDRTKRNKVMLGVLIYQGITNRELHRLEVKDIELKAGKIYINGSRNTNNRTLSLAMEQMLDLQEYLLIVRPSMLRSINNGDYKQKAGRKTAEIDSKIERQLFFSESGSCQLKNSLKHLFVGVEKLHTKVSSAKVIRSVVIGNWLRLHDVRRVQYMVGHKYVSSTEKYDLVNIEELEKGLENYHPMR